MLQNSFRPIPVQQRQDRFATSQSTVLREAIRREMPSWKYAGAIMIAGSLLYGQAQAAPDVCGAPPLNLDSEAAVLLWKDCATDTWSVVASAGGNSSVLTFEGRVSADQPVSLVTGVALESNDVLNASDPRDIAYKLNVTQTWYDGFDFRHPSTANACFDVTTPGAKVLVGPGRVPVTSPVNLKTLGPCGETETTCGTLDYKAATDGGTFLWRDCDTGLWHLRIAGGGKSSYTSNDGNLTSDKALASVTGFSMEANDVLDTSQSGRINYKLTVGGTYEDGIDFALADDASACLDTGNGDAQVLVGPERIAVSSPFDIRTLGACGTTPVEPPPPPPPPPVSKTTYQVVTPQALDAYAELRNPGRGIEQAGKIMNNGTFNYNSAVEADSDITYIRLPWAVLEPNGDNQWNWTALDAAIENSVSRGKQAAISVISWRPVLDNNNYQDAVPAWYRTSSRHVKCTSVDKPAGCTYYLVNSSIDCALTSSQNCSNRWAFNHDDPIFIKNQVELIDAIRARYDNAQWAEKIAYMDVRSIGSWSENHATGITIAGTSSRWPMPKWTNMKAIIDAHLDYEHIPQIVNFDNDDKYRETDGTHPWDYACREAQLGGQTIGWRTDGIEVTLWEINQVWSWSEAAKNCWKTGPVYAEAMSGSGLPAANLTEGLTRLTNWQASGWNNKYASTYPKDAAYTAEVDEWLMDAGYRLNVPEAMIPKTAVANQSFNVELDLANLGNAPFYRNFYELQLRFSPVGSGKEVIVSFPGDLRSILPGEPAVTFTGSGALPAGEYRVSVGLIEDSTFGSSFPVKLAQNSSSCTKEASGWWCDIGTTTSK